MPFHGDHAKWKLVTVYASIFAMMVMSLVYTNLAQRNTEEKFCSIITTVADAYRKGPDPATPLGRDLKAKYFKLEKDLRC